ncbi:MAG: D-inositol-3-phosphate glycosyltransferase [Saprospiraceae bacterium]|jgi:glycosyltransferase involved in cell wall biosynthesis|nr:D-inositol-3-phosphate glycosyltransferase [Saprospiraceae bacterium]
MPRMLMIGPAYPFRGGLANFNERLAREFQNKGWQVTILTFTLQYPRLLFPGKTQYSTEGPPDDLDIEQCVHSLNPLNWVRLGLRLRREKADLILTRYWIPFMAPSLGTILRIARKNHKGQIVCLADNIVPHEPRPGDQCLTRYFVKIPDRFICMSEVVETDLRKFRPDAPVSMQAHPLFDGFGPPVEQAEAKRVLGIEGSGPIVLFFGFIRRYKGLDLLIEALADPMLANTGVRLLVAGEFYDREDNYLELIDAHGLAERVILHTDFIPDSKVKYYFGACDIVVQPYRSATQSGVTPLAYYFEKPMVVTRVGGLPEQVPEGRAGYSCDPEPASIADAIARFLQVNPQTFVPFLRSKKEELSWSHFADQILATQQSTHGKPNH